MKTILDQLFTPFLSEIGLYREEKGPKQSGLCYKPDPATGDGFVWIYPVDNLYAITIYDVVFKEDVSFGYRHPAFLSVGTYAEPIAKLMYDTAALQEESLLGYVGDNAVYQQEVKKGIPLRCIGVSLLPEFYETLAARFSQDFRKLPDIISKLCGTAAIPEVETALKQIRASRPSGGLAKAYYEGKVLEILSIIMQWGENQMWFPEKARLRDWELESLHEISSYLKQNYAGHVSLGMLARIACMSQNKLTHTFKQVHGMTITGYIQSLRVEKAKDLLLNSDWDVGQIAASVGYKLHRSFSEVFKETTGFTPSEFRKQIV